MAIISSKIKMVLILLVLAIGGVTIMYLYIASAVHQLQATQPKPVNGMIGGTIGIVNDSLFTYNIQNNTAADYIYYAVVRYAFKNATVAHFSIATYNRPPLPRIYIVNTTVGAENYCLQCFVNKQQLFNSFYTYLNKYGLIVNSTSLNYVGINNLSTIPHNSIIIMQSGLMPVGLLPDSLVFGSHVGNGTFTILDLMRRGDTIVYIGRNFSQEVGTGEEIFVTPPTGIAALTNASIITQGAQPNRTNVTANSLLVFDTPNFQFLGGRKYGNVTTINYSNGSIVAFSNYPSVGWKTTDQLASDVAIVLESRFWIKRFAYDNISVNLTENASGENSGILPLATLQKEMDYNSSTAKLVNNSFSMVGVRLYNNYTGGFYEISLPFKRLFTDKGIIATESVFGETQTLPIAVSVKNLSKVQTTFSIQISNATGVHIGVLPVGFYNNSFQIIYSRSFEMQSGYYIATLKDINGKTYSSAYFQLAPVNVTPVVIDFKNETFEFNLESNNLTLSDVPYKISLDGGYAENGIIYNGRANYTPPQHLIISYGTQVFTINVFGSNYTYTSSYLAPITASIPPLYIEFGIAGIVIVLLNLILKAPTSDDYYIDVPTFMASTKVKIKVDKESVISVFENVNYYYHWHYMPLTADEVKSGISTSIRYENVPIAVTIQNTVNVLNGLVKSGDLVTAMNYYAPKRWTEQSKHDIEYLAIFREVRDFCVAHAILFTDLDAGQHADMIITKQGNQANIFIYSAASGVREVALGSPFKTFIIFIDETTKLTFLNNLYASYGDKAELLKIAVEYGSVILIEAANLNLLTV